MCLRSPSCPALPFLTPVSRRSRPRSADTLLQRSCHLRGASRWFGEAEVAVGATRVPRGSARPTRLSWVPTHMAFLRGKTLLLSF